MSQMLLKEPTIPTRNDVDKILWIQAQPLKSLQGRLGRDGQRRGLDNWRKCTVVIKQEQTLLRLGVQTLKAIYRYIRCLSGKPLQTNLAQMHFDENGGP